MFYSVYKFPLVQSCPVLSNSIYVIFSQINLLLRFYSDVDFSKRDSYVLIDFLDVLVTALNFSYAIVCNIRKTCFAIRWMVAGLTSPNFET